MDPVEILKEEHRNILRGVDLLDRLARIAQKGELLVDPIDNMVHFFRQYADVGHHQKEEDLLFTALFEKDETLQGEFSPIGELQAQHVEGRRLVGRISAKTSFSDDAQDYGSLIRRHIEIEDTLFPELVVSRFDTSEMEQLRVKFLEVEDLNTTAKLLALLDT
ncbi:MAG: hemerythrin domain-containing protein, partial [Candidatus Kariarchaeaceae archaeon]